MVAEDDQHLDDIDSEDDDEIDPSALPRKKISGKKIFIVLAVLAVLSVIGGALKITGVMDKLMGKTDETPQAEEQAVVDDGPGFFYPLEMLVNLNSTDRIEHLLKIKIQLELNSENDVPAIEKVLPRVKDHFQVYLRELRPDDLRGSHGFYRLREELLSRVTLAAHPIRIRDVLFDEFLVQ